MNRIIMAVMAIGFVIILVAGTNIVRAEDRNQALIEAADKGNLEKVRELLETGADVNAKGEDGETALTWACINGHLEVVNLLLDKGADANTVDKSGWTALTWASIKGHFEVAKVLLDKGVDVNIKDRRAGATALAWACNGHLDIVKLLLDKGADINTKIDSGWTVLIEAAWGGKLELVKLLLREGADINAKDNNGKNALIWAASEGRLEIVRLLLDEGADINAKDKDGKTALMEASKNQQLEVVNVLQKKAATTFRNASAADKCVTKEDMVMFLDSQSYLNMEDFIKTHSVTKDMLSQLLNEGKAKWVVKDTPVVKTGSIGQVGAVVELAAVTLYTFDQFISCSHETPNIEPNKITNCTKTDICIKLTTNRAIKEVTLSINCTGFFSRSCYKWKGDLQEGENEILLKRFTTDDGKRFNPDEYSVKTLEASSIWLPVGSANFGWQN